MPAIIECPACGRKLRVPDDLPSSRVKCPACGGLFEATREPGTADGAAGELPLQVVPDDGEPLPLIPGVPPPPAPLRPVLISSSHDPRPAPRETLEWCIACGSRLPARARICPFCGADFRKTYDESRPWERPGAPPRPDWEPHRGALIYPIGLVSLLLAVPSLCGSMCLPFTVAGVIGLALGVTGWVMAHHDLRLIEEDVMDPEGREIILLGRNYAIAGTVVASLGIVLSALVHILLLTELP
jgi:hypothetical protein